MVTRLKKWGNRQGLPFPKALLEDAHLNMGDAVHVSVRGRQIIIEPGEKVRGRYDLRRLVPRMPAGYRVEEVKWGGPVGKGEW